MKKTKPILSYNDHFKFGYDDIPLIDRKTSVDKWWVQYGRCTRSPKSFREECLETAKLIRASTEETIWVLFSGGVDSEVALRSFAESGISVKAAIARYKHNLNDHDINYAFDTCRDLKVPFEVFDLDLIKFWKEDYLSYAIPTQCISPQLAATMHLIDQVPGYPVIGSGECLLMKEEDKYFLYEKERIASWYRHFIVKNKDGCPGFFQFTPEIILSYLYDPMIREMVKNKSQNSSAQIKLQMYQTHFDLKPRPKYTGFEKVQDEDYVARKRLKELFPHSDEIFKTEYNELLSQLSYR